MVGTKAGGIKAAKTNLEKHGADFYKRIGKKEVRMATPVGLQRTVLLLVLLALKVVEFQEEERQRGRCINE